jgi:hypothetical protein
VVRQYEGGYFSFLVFVETCFVTQDMVYFEKVPWAAEKNVYCAAAGWNAVL